MKEVEEEDIHNPGWVFVAFQPEQIFILHTLIRMAVRARRDRRKRPGDNMLIAEHILETTCQALTGKEE